MKITSASMVITPDVPLTEVSSFFGNKAGVKVSLLRLDQMHPIVSGNKWFKLKYNLQAAVDGGFSQIITFGGAYSNHLIATAAAANAHGLKTIGIVRGLHAKDQLTPTLQACIAQQMQLHFVSREAYAAKEDLVFLQTLIEKFGPSFIIPEGGDNELGRLGAEDIAAHIPEITTHVCIPVGTGTTLVGLRRSLPLTQEVIGFTAIKGGGYLHPAIEAHLNIEANRNWELQTDYSFNGFAKSTPELTGFIRSFNAAAKVPLDIVYTAKMMYGVQDLINKKYFPAHAHIVCIHTGGLQGNPADLFGT